MEAANQTGGKQPAHTIALGNFGPRITIWENDKGPRYSLVLDRSYKDANGQWQRTQTMDGHDAPSAAFLYGQAADWISRQQG